MSEQNHFCGIVSAIAIPPVIVVVLLRHVTPRDRWPPACTVCLLGSQRLRSLHPDLIPETRMEWSKKPSRSWQLVPVVGAHSDVNGITVYS